MEAKTLARVTRGLLWLVAAGVVLLLGGLYFHGGVQGLFLEAYGVGPEGKAGVLLFLTLMAGIALWILGELIGVLATVERDPFVEGNAPGIFPHGAGRGAGGRGFYHQVFYPVYLYDGGLRPGDGAQRAVCPGIGPGVPPGGPV